MKNETDYKELLNFYKGKRVLITGNTGFKGSWLTYILLSAGAEITGYSLQSLSEFNLFSLAGLDSNPDLHQICGDIRDMVVLKDVFQSASPEIVLHLAAQPIVRDSYRDPMTTYTTNVNGTLNVLECMRTMPGVRSFLNVTTDKVYKNFEWEYGYRENDPLDGYDPYSNSKSCSELITHSYKDSFFMDKSVAISTVRAGNVIGGGDFSSDRIIPDCVRAIDAGRKEGKSAIIGVRNPYSTRPYQHVLEALFMYLIIVMKQYEDASYADYYNVGPDDIDCVTTGDLVSTFCEKWNKGKTKHLPELYWENRSEADAPHESNFLKLDCSKVKARFGWHPHWHIEKAIEQIVGFTNIWMSGENVKTEMDKEIEEYIKSDEIS